MHSGVCVRTFFEGKGGEKCGRRFAGGGSGKTKFSIREGK